MFRWYREATKCYVYLSDVSTENSDQFIHDQLRGSTWESAFRVSKWFTRGWTLQELIAPASVEFFSREGEWLGDKRSLEQQVYEITGIPIEALRGSPLSCFTVDERILWAENRETRRKEDKAYSLMGIFDIHMPLIYGEGKEKALVRLRNEMDKHSSNPCLEVLEAKLSKIRQWLSSPDPSLNHQKAIELCQAHTGTWFLESTEFIAWKNNPASFLWLYGIPGCGKTILSSTILQDIIQYCADDPGKVVAYFYFDFNDPQKQLTTVMIRSLVFQLSEQCVKTPTSLEILFSSCGKGQKQPSLDSLLEVMYDMIQEYPQSYIVLDALDECKDRLELMTIIEKIAGWKLAGSHLLVTSRKERDIESSLENIVDTQNTICLQSQLVDKDILTYIRQRLSNDKSLSKWQKVPDIRREIETALMKGAHGMFRLAVCQLDILGKCRNRLSLRRSLERLPPTLDETYYRILCAVDKEDSEYFVRILQWLSFSSRPLLVEEVAEVVAIDVDRNPSYNSEEVLEDPLDVLSICSSLVTITTIEQVSKSRKKGRSKVVTLAHYSVKEYLTSERILQSGVARYSLRDIVCNEFIAKSCIGYLLQFRTPGVISSENIQESKLARYAAGFWTTHAQVVMQKSEALNRLIMELFSTGNGAHLNWVRIYNAVQTYNPQRLLSSPFRLHSFTETLEEVPAPLWYASLYGLTDIVNLLILEPTVNVNAKVDGYVTALESASAGGYDEIIELLLSKGADINAQGGIFGTALQAASAGGYYKVIELLLSKGVDINAQGGSFGTALQAASFRGYYKVIELLLSKGVDINAQGGIFGTALQAASCRGHFKVIELLLDKGADINAQGGDFGTALQWGIS